MNPFEIVFTDIDGTFLNSSHRITERTKSSVNRVLSSGAPFVLASSRMPDAIRPVLDEAGIRQPIICYGGGLIMDENGRELYSDSLTAETAWEVGHFIEMNFKSVTWNAYSGHKWLCAAPKSEWVLKEEQITKIAADQGSLEEIKTWENVHKLLCMGDYDVITALQERLKAAFPDLLICRSSASYLEVTSSTVSKGAALRTLCRIRRIPAEKSLAFGDNYNDLDMLLKAGKGYAMANAPAEIKKLVKNMAADNDHDGLARVLEQYF